MKATQAQRTTARARHVPLWLSILIDAFIVSIPCIIKKVAKLIKQIGG